ncbi:MAG: hypothetical protein VX271_02350, partial [Candidatus Neomarinimicrobiota bacterium]|nr:hypothetical protein [Candidatus Neomarinimicrobiota bacterium]
LFISISEISKLVLLIKEISSIFNLVLGEELVSFFLVGEILAGTNINRSKCSDSKTVCAIKRCPIWGGSKVPPKIQVFIFYPFIKL